MAGMAFSVTFPVALALLLTWCGYLEYQDKLISGEDEDLDKLKSERENWKASRSLEETRPVGKGIASGSSNEQQLRAAPAVGPPNQNTVLESFDSALSASSASSAVHVKPINVTAAKLAG